MITCRELADTLLEFVSGEMDGDGRARVEHHLGRCPSCRAFHDTYLLTVRLARQLPPRPMPPRLVQQIQALLAAGGPAAPPPGP